MNLGEVLSFIVEDGIEAAKGSYTKPADRLKLSGSIRGFEECRGQSPSELAALLKHAEQAVRQAMISQSADYWYWRCRCLEIQWVCNVLGSVLTAQGLAAIPGVPLTARGVAKAAEIVGIAGA